MPLRTFALAIVFSLGLAAVSTVQEALSSAAAADASPGDVQLPYAQLAFAPQPACAAAHGTAGSRVATHHASAVC